MAEANYTINECYVFESTNLRDYNNLKASMVRFIQEEVYVLERLEEKVRIPIYKISQCVRERFSRDSNKVLGRGGDLKGLANFMVPQTLEILGYNPNGCFGIWVPGHEAEIRLFRRRLEEMGISMRDH